jgi:hypothetical protein
MRTTHDSSQGSYLVLSVQNGNEIGNGDSFNVVGEGDQRHADTTTDETSLNGNSYVEDTKLGDNPTTSPIQHTSVANAIASEEVS